MSMLVWVTCQDVLQKAPEGGVVAALHGLHQRGHGGHLGGCELGVDTLQVCMPSEQKHQKRKLNLMAK